MNTENFLDHLRSLNIKLTVNDDDLKCSAPPGVLTPDLRAKLAEHKAEILGLLQANNFKKSPKIEVVDRNGNLPLSFAQQRLWFLDQLEGHSKTYNISEAIQLFGYLDINALEQAISEIVRRHEALRTTFQTLDGEPIQVITAAESQPLTVVDLRSWSETERSGEAQRLANEAANTTFELENGPLIRCQLLKLTQNSHVLLMTMHHIVSDGWSLGIFARELSALYRDFSQGNPLSLPELSIQYADFAHWQRKYLQGEFLEQQLSYWKKQLANAPALLALPTDYPRPPRQTFQGSTVHFCLDAKLSQKLQVLSKKSGTTLFITLLGAFSVLLHRYSAAEEIMIGSPIANRNHYEIEPLIGFFANTLLLRTNLEGNPSFLELLQRLHHMALDAYAHQDLPFQKLVEELDPERNLSYHPLFQVMFVLQNATADVLDLPNIQLSSLQLELGIAKFDLTLSMHETAEGLAGTCEYSSDLFKDETIQRLVGHFQTLIECIVNTPKQIISTLPLLTEIERNQLLVEWNHTTIDYPQDKCIHQLFEEQVEKTPEAIAVVFEEQQLTYRELNNRANQLAHYLQSEGVKPEALVGICVERSPEMVVGILGILKAGGAYVPLDPDYPNERLAFMLEDSQITVLLTQAEFIQQFSASATTIICLNSESKVTKSENNSNLVNHTQLKNLAYVIYTSGSTGRPKGVAMEHLALSNLIHWQQENTTVSERHKTLQFASISFDVSFQEIFSTLCSGGTLVVISKELRREPIALLRLLREQQVARLFLPFVALQQIAEISQSTGLFPTNLREVITAGEQLQVTPAIASFFSELNNCTFYNHYGPSESHVVTSFTLTMTPQEWPALPPIGRPISNTQIYILDSHLQAVPIGVPGELYIGGMGLARGYLNRPELTKEKFIPNIFSQQEGDRLYKTGDLARYLPDGNIEFLGRIDNQVKIRGFRIELGEIEATLSGHEQIKEVVAIAREDIPGEKRIAAYLITGETIPQISELRSFLKAKLPDYMVPSAFVFLETLPLTPNGKVDRRALPAPDPNQRTIETQFVAPRTALEKKVSQIWCDVLKLEQVGIYDNFFELGGHSLLATQVISQIRQHFQIELSLRSLFEHPTITDCAKDIDRFIWLEQQTIENLNSSSDANWEEFEL